MSMFLARPNGSCIMLYPGKYTVEYHRPPPDHIMVIGECDAGHSCDSFEFACATHVIPSSLLVHCFVQVTTCHCRARRPAWILSTRQANHSVCHCSSPLAPSMHILVAGARHVACLHACVVLYYWLVLNQDGRIDTLATAAQLLQIIASQALWRALCVLMLYIACLQAGIAISLGTYVGNFEVVLGRQVGVPCQTAAASRISMLPGI